MLDSCFCNAAVIALAIALVVVASRRRGRRRTPDSSPSDTGRSKRRKRGSKQRRARHSRSPSFTRAHSEAQLQSALLRRLGFAVGSGETSGGVGSGTGHGTLLPVGTAPSSLSDTDATAAPALGAAALVAASSDGRLRGGDRAAPRSRRESESRRDHASPSRDFCAASAAASSTRHGSESSGARRAPPQLQSGGGSAGAAATTRSAAASNERGGSAGGGGGGGGGSHESSVQRMEGALQVELHEEHLKLFSVLGRGGFGTVYHGAPLPRCNMRLHLTKLAQLWKHAA